MESVEYVLICKIHFGIITVQSLLDIVIFIIQLRTCR